jgi:hypothetical protein
LKQAQKIVASIYTQYKVLYDDRAQRNLVVKHISHKS